MAAFIADYWDTATNASTITEHRVKTCRLAVIVQPDLLITLDGTGTSSKTQQCNCGNRRPNHGSKTYPAFHAIKPPRPDQPESYV
jgi:hypothetical protein